MKVKEMSTEQIRQKIETYHFVIDRCQEYLNRTSPITFLGPLGARATIRKCKNKIDILEKELRLRIN